MRTERLIIRNFERTQVDFESLYRIFSDEEVNKFLPWYPLADMDEVENFYAERILPRVEDKAKGYYFAICLREDHVPIGYVTVGPAPNYDFGYGVRKEFWGQGIITEASKEVLEFLKEKKYSFVTATHDVENVASGKVMEKLGMSYRYSYRELWQPKDQWVTFRMYQYNLDGKSHPTYRGYWDKYPKYFIEEVE